MLPPSKRTKLIEPVNGRGLKRRSVEMEDSGLLTKRQKSVIASLLQRNLLRRNEFGELDKQLEGFIELPQINIIGRSVETEDSGLLTKRQKSVIASLLQRNLLRRNEFGELDKQLEGFIEFPNVNNFPPNKCNIDVKVIKDAFLRDTNFEKIQENPCAVCCKLQSNVEVLHSNYISEYLKILARDSRGNYVDNHENFVDNYNNFLDNYVTGCPIIREFCGKYWVHHLGLKVHEGILYVQVCPACKEHLLDDVVPRFSLPHSFVGEVPVQLRDLSRAEKLCVSRVRLVAHIVTLKGGNRCVKGNTCFFQSPTDKIATKLPLAAQDLAGYIKVSFARNITPDAIPKLFTIRRKFVLDALVWLKINNPLYNDIILDYEALNTLPEDGIASQIICSNNEEGVVGQLDLNGEILNTITNSAMVNAVNLISTTDAASNTLNNFLHIKSGCFVPGYKEKLFELAYPWLFPIGINGPCIKSGRFKSDFKAHVAWLLSYSDRRFSYDESFLFVAQSVWNRNETSRLSRFKFKKACADNDLLNNCTVNDLKESYQTMLKGGKSTNERANALLCRLKLVQAPIEGSDLSKNRARNKIKSMIFCFGQPAFFLTINPCDVHSPLLMVIAGIKVNLSTLEGFPIRQFRDDLIGKDPVSCAKFCDLLFQKTIDHLLGFQLNQGLLGKPLAYAGSIEEQGRKSLHMHLLFWLKDYCYETFLLQIANDDTYAGRVVDYLSFVIKESVRGVYFTDISKTSRFNSSLERVHDADTVLDSGRTSLGTDLASGFNSNLGRVCKLNHDVDTANHTYLGNKKRSCVIWDKPPDFEDRHSTDISVCSYPPVNPSESNYDLKNDYDIRALVVNCQIHVHNQTCSKLNNGYCRMRFGRKLYDKPGFENGCIKLERSHPYINNYNRTMLSVLRCNTDIKFIGSSSQAKHLVHYITNYITKKPINTFSVIDLCIKALNKKKDVASSVAGEASINAHKLVVSCLSSINGSIEMGAPMSALYMMGKSDFYCSNSFVDVNLNFCFRWYYIQTAQDENNEDLYETIYIRESNVVFTNLFDDYLNRPLDLRHLNYIKFVTGFKKVPISKCEYKFRDNYALSLTHGIQKREKELLPNFCGKPIPSIKHDFKTFKVAILLLFYPIQTCLGDIDESYAFLIQKSNLLAKFVLNVKLFQQGLENESVEEHEGDKIDEYFNEVGSIPSVFEENVVDVLTVELDDNDIVDQVTEIEEYFPGMTNQDLNQRFFECSSSYTNVDSMDLETADLKNLLKQQKLFKLGGTPLTPDIDTLSVEDVIVRETNIADHIKRFANSKNLLGRQRLAICGFLYSMELSKFNKNKQAVMAVLGEGGVGKSKIIHSILDYFVENGQKQSLKITGPTGTSASKIKGVTIHSLLNLLSKTPNLQNLQEALEHVIAIILDECGFVGLKLLYKIDQSLRQIKNQDMPFGGINFLFLGDFYQLKPVKDYPLYTTIGHISEKSASREMYVQGILAWQYVKDVIFLYKNYRAMGDRDYQSLLRKIRQERLTNDDLEYLRSACIDSCEKNLKSAVFLTSNNVTKSGINKLYSQNFSKANSIDIYNYIATDKIQDSSLTLQFKTELLLQPDTPEIYPGILSLGVGMKVMILINIYPSLKIMNGSVGTVVQCSKTSEKKDSYVVVEFDWLKAEGIKFGQLGLGCILFQCRTTTFKFTSSTGETFTVHRNQLPMTLAKAYTVHKFQGETAKQGLVVVWDKFFEIIEMLYVTLSRVTCLNDLVLIGDISPNVLRMTWNQLLKDHCKILKFKEHDTLNWINELFPTTSPEDYTILIEEENLEMEDNQFLWNSNDSMNRNYWFKKFYK